LLPSLSLFAGLCLGVAGLVAACNEVTGLDDLNFNGASPTMGAQDADAPDSGSDARLDGGGDAGDASTTGEVDAGGPDADGSTD
jgi:hypothetical protein